MAKKIHITIDPDAICTGTTKEENTPAYKVGEILKRYGELLISGDGILPRELPLKDTQRNEVGTFLLK